MSSVDENETSYHKYLYPNAFQCLECLEDMKTIQNLMLHMLQTSHLNNSWAIQTNNREENDAINKTYAQQLQVQSGRWFQKLTTNYRCGICNSGLTHSTTASNMFASLQDVFQHIISTHRREFEIEYIKIQ